MELRVCTGCWFARSEVMSGQRLIFWWQSSKDNVTPPAILQARRARWLHRVTISGGNSFIHICISIRGGQQWVCLMLLYTTFIISSTLKLKFRKVKTFQFNYLTNTIWNKKIWIELKMRKAYRTPRGRGDVKTWKNYFSVRSMMIKLIQF